MLNKKLLTAAVATALMSGAGYSLAQEKDDLDPRAEAFEISGNVALTSDYRFRGISQSDESAAIQGGFDVEFSPGFYVGTWGSSVDFDSNEGYDGSLEL
ncbi:MAG: TorF family putative porin, partial [Halioglobus sp.]|nr:TorF family putative porin [Halioglobus sp.]